MASAPATLTQLLTARLEMSGLCIALRDLRAPGLPRIDIMLGSAVTLLQSIDDKLTTIYRRDEKPERK